MTTNTPDSGHSGTFRTEVVVRDGNGQLVYRLHVPGDLLADRTYLEALLAGETVGATACEPPKEARIVYATSLDALREWADRVRRGP